MTQRTPPPKTPFDTLTSSTRLDMMKLFIPMMPSSYQSMFAIMIKFQEIQETIRVFRNFPNGIQFNVSTDIFSTIKPYLPPENPEMFDTISNMRNIMEMMNAMSESSDDNNSMDFLKNMLSPEQQAMFDTMNQMYDETTNPDS